MATPISQQGLLDTSKIQPKQYVKLPKALASFVAPDKDPPGPLFEREPSIEDLHALSKASPVDPHLYHGFASLLGGLASGPGLVMGMFRAIENEVVIRMFLPQRPHPTKPPQPLYFRVQSGHAALAVQKKWIGPGAPRWLALFTAVYYAYIKDRDAYYKREDLGGKDNAAWLLLYGKDSSRADYKDDKEAEAGAGGGAADGGSDRQGMLQQILGAPSGKVDLAFCAKHVFDEPKGAGPRTKAWAAWLSKAKVQPSTGLRSGLRREALADQRLFKKWLKERPGLDPQAMAQLLLFLEINGLFAAVDKERYLEGARALWDRMAKVLKARAPVVAELRPGDPALPSTEDKDFQKVEVARLEQLEMPGGKGGPRNLRFVVLKTSEDGSGSQKYVWKSEEGVVMLTAKPDKLPHHWVELEQFMGRAVRVLGGALAAAAMTRPTDQDFIQDLAALAKKAR